MITQDTCYAGFCDNCGELFNDGDYSMFPLQSDVRDRMNEREWYADGTDPDHKGKHYCPECFTHHIEIDDKIVLDSSRYKPAPPESQESRGGEEEDPDEFIVVELLKQFLSDDWAGAEGQAERFAVYLDTNYRVMDK